MLLYSFQFVFQLVFPAYTLQLRSICVLPTAFKTFCSNKLGILTGKSWHFSNISSDISAWWAHESTSLDLKKANEMLTSHAKRIFSDHVTCFGKNKSCSNRSHLPQCFIKALCFLLAWLLCFYAENPRLFLEGDVRNTPDCPGRNNLYFALENKDWKNVPCLFSVASSLVLFVFGHGVETSNLGDVSAQKLCQASGDFSLEQVGIDVSAPWTHESNSIDVYTATHARGIFSDNVTCFGTNKCCSNWSHLSGCFKCSSLLACKAPRVQLSICFPIGPSRIHLTSSLYLCPADCFQDILFEQAGNSHWKKLAFLQHIKWHICTAGELKYLTWCQKGQ